MPADTGCLTRFVRAAWRAAIVYAAAIVALVASVGVLSACGAHSAQPIPTGAANLGELGAGQLGIYLSTRASPQNTAPSQSNAGRLYAVRASDGAPVWSAATDGPVLGLNAGDGTLYVSVATWDSSSVMHGGVVALRLRDGAQLWRQTGDRPELPVAAGDGALFIVTALGTVTKQGAQQEQVQALRASDGHPLWTVTLQGTPTGGQGFGTAFGGGALYLPVIATQSAGTAQQERVQALRDSDGTPLWSTGPSGVVIGPVASNGVVYAQSTEGGGATGSPAQTSVLAWRASDGKPLWKHTLFAAGQSGGATALVPSGDALSVGLGFAATPAGTPPDQLLALNAATGAELWRHDAGGPVQEVAADARNASALYVATTAYTSSSFGTPPTTSIRALSTADGKPLWEHSVANGGGPSGTIGVFNGVVYLPIAAPGSSGVAQELEALDARDGVQRWTRPIDGIVSTWLAAPA